MTDDLLVWLREQLDEDERLARAATCDAWRVTERSDHPYTEDGEIHTVTVHARWVGDKAPEPYRVVTHGDFHEAVDRPDAEHIARWDPARVLREVEAKRRLVELHANDPEIEDGPACGVCSWRDDMEELQGEWPCLTARLLALPYSDRPGYRQEWVP